MTGRRRHLGAGRLALAALLGAGAIAAGSASAAPLSCVARPLDEMNSGRGPVATVALSATGDGAVAWTPTSRSTGEVRIRAMRGANLRGAGSALAGDGRVKGLQVVPASTGSEVLLLFQRVGGAGPQAVVAAAFDGRRIATPTTLSRGHASLPDVSVGPDGSVRVVWIEPVPFVGYKVVTATRPPEGDWSAPEEVAIVPPPTTIDGVQVVAGRGGRATIAWRSDVTGVEALTLGPDGQALVAPVPVRAGAAFVGRVVLGGSPSGAEVAWIETAGAGVSRLSVAHLSPEGQVGPIRLLSRDLTTAKEVWVSTGPSRFGVLAWTERGGGKLRARVSRLDTRDGSLTAWIAPVTFSETGVGIAVAAGGRGAVTWRAFLDGRRVTRIASGSLTSVRPTDHATVAGAPRGPGAPSIALGQAGQLAVAGIDIVPRSFRSALRLATCGSRTTESR